MTDRQHYTIRIKEGNEHHSSTMDIYDEDAFFYSSYRQAAATVTKIVNLSNDFLSACAPSQPSRDTSLAEYHNNIVAFCADRGQGKTSAMLSMAEALRQMGDSDGRKAAAFWNHPSVMAASGEATNPVLKTRFEVLETVDPTCMVETDSILRMIITKMYKSASEMWKRYRGSHYDEKDIGSKQNIKEQFAEKFIECYKGVDFLYKADPDIDSYYDDLNQLAEYGDSNHFKSNFSELVKLYLQFTGMLSESYAPNSNAMLVIQIDDPDLNAKNVFTIAEEIRKYLMLPRVLVLMAAHIGTLARSIEQYYLKEYETIIRLSEDNDIAERCHTAMERYIEKWIPSSHRVNLTYIAQFLRDEYSDITLSYVDKSGKEMLSFPEAKEKDSGMTYQNQLILLIYRKTGIILCKPDYYLHDFLPNNLRELNHFLYTLNTMEDVIRKDEQGQTVGTYQSILEMLADFINGTKPNRQIIIDEINLHLKNLSLFSDYLRNAWCPKRLTNEQLKKVLNLHKTSHVLINLRTVDLVKEYIKKLSGINARNATIYRSDDDRRCREQPGITGKRTPLSDINYTLYQLRHQDNPQKHFYLICAIRVYYSIYLHKVALSGIMRWAEMSDKPEGTPFTDLIRLTGNRIFPILYYQLKGLPMLIFRFRHDAPVTPSDNNGGDNEYTVLQYFTCPCDWEEAPAKTSEKTATVPAIDGVGDEDKLYAEVDYSPENTNFLFHDNALSGNKNYFSINSEYQYFDIFRPLTAALIFLRYSDLTISETEVPAKAKERIKNKAKDLADVLTLICNTDVQELLYQKFFKETSELNKPEAANQSPPEERVFAYISGIYDQMDNAVNNGVVTHSDFSLLSVFKNTFRKSHFIGFTRCNGINDMINVRVPNHKYRLYAVMEPDFSYPEITEEEMERLKHQLEDSKKASKPGIPDDELEYLAAIASAQDDPEAEA